VAVHTAFKYLCNLAGTDYELPEDGVRTCKGSIIMSSIINCWSIVHLLVHYTNRLTMYVAAGHREMHNRNRNVKNIHNWCGSSLNTIHNRSNYVGGILFYRTDQCTEVNSITCILITFTFPPVHKWCWVYFSLIISNQIMFYINV